MKKQGKKNKRTEARKWSLDDWAREHRDELLEHRDARALVHPDLGLLIADSGRSDGFLLKLTAIRRSIALDCQVMLVGDMLRRLEMESMLGGAKLVFDDDGHIEVKINGPTEPAPPPVMTDPFDDPWNDPNAVMDGANHPNDWSAAFGELPVEPVVNEVSGSSALPQRAVVSPHRQPPYMPARPSPSRMVIDGAGRSWRGR